jgi:hypothetical protein
VTLQPPIKGLTVFCIGDRTQLVLVLSKLRQEWQEAVDGGSLLKVETPVGLLLSDIADRLNLTEQERYVILGRSLASEIADFMGTRVRRKLPN